MCRCARAAGDNATEARDARGSRDAFSGAPGDDSRGDGRDEGEAKDPPVQVTQKTVEIAEKTEAKNGLKNHFVATEKAATEENLTLKLEAGNEEKIEKPVRDARNWLDKNRLAENDDSEAQQKEWE